MNIPDFYHGDYTCTVNTRARFRAGLPNGDLYHYTSAAGFLGLVEHKMLWLTNYAFLSDSQEYAYAIDVVNEVMAEYRDFGLGRPELRLDDMPSAYTFSISEEGDLLSQWRGYCPDGGYCISFNSAQLNALISREDFLSGKCIYDREEQKAFVRSLLPYQPQDIRSRMGQFGAGAPNITRIRHEIYACIIQNSSLLLLLKHPAFSQEAEWRIICSNSGDPARRKLKFRPGKSMLIPYLEIPLIESAAEGTETDRIVLEKVIVSTGPNQKTAELGAKMVVKQYNCCEPHKVISSTIPYRYW